MATLLLTTLLLVPASEGGLYGADTTCPAVTSVEVDGQTFGAAADERGSIGGGAGYVAGIRSGDHQVRDLDGLLQALAGAVPGEVIFLPGDVVIDLTGMVFIEALVLELPGGVTLASDRGVEGSPGALLFSDALLTRPLIRVTGDDARLSGLRLQGPDAERRLDHHRRAYQGTRERDPDYYYGLPTSDGIETRASRLEVDGCELAGWSHAGVFLRGGTGHRVHHNFIHHCQRQGLGYGVCLDLAEAEITHNLFDWNRHSIAATGRAGGGYRAAHNVERGASLSHLFDMHGGRDRGDGTNVAGTWISVERNTFLCERTAFVVRGQPEQEARFEGNWCVHAGPAQAVRGESRTLAGANAYGIETPRVVTGR
ncbi:MAG: hypothetical protein O2816_03255 [Planctomycetota bacterium]|nr:hypothetical protein [Planctomycetota bacterium]